jgi:hypothetical protein
MIKLTTALLLTLGVGVSIASTARAQGECWWVGCNLEAPWCRFYCGTDDPDKQKLAANGEHPMPAPIRTNTIDT